MLKMAVLFILLQFGIHPLIIYLVNNEDTFSIDYKQTCILVKEKLLQGTYKHNLFYVYI